MLREKKNQFINDSKREADIGMLSRHVHRYSEKKAIRFIVSRSFKSYTHGNVSEPDNTEPNILWSIYQVPLMLIP